VVVSVIILVVAVTVVVVPVIVVVVAVTVVVVPVIVVVVPVMLVVVPVVVDVIVAVVELTVVPVAIHTRSPLSVPSYAPLVPHVNTNPFAAPVVLNPALHTGMQVSPELRGAHDE
jgi:hypothetical protein